MEIFKVDVLHQNLVSDIKAASSLKVITRLAEKSMDTLLEELDNMMWLNLTEEGAAALRDLSNRNPDSEIGGLLEFLIFKNSVKVESAKDFVLRTGTDTIDEDTVAQVRVYKDDFFIEVLHDGRHYLCVENYDWIEPHTTLEAMELELFNFVKAYGGQ